MSDRDMADPGAKLVRNERVRLAATLGNNIAVALIVTGGIVPLVAFVYGNTVAYGRLWPVCVILFLVMGFLCHRAASFILKGLRP